MGKYGPGSNKTAKFNTYVKNNLQSIATGTPTKTRREGLTKAKVTNRLLNSASAKGIKTTHTLKNAAGIISNGTITGDM